MRRVGLALAALAAVLVVPSAVHAQGSGSSGGRSLPNFQTSKTFEGKIIEIDAKEGYLVVSLKEGSFWIEIHEKTKLKADKKTGLNEKEMTFQDVPVGSRVKLTVRSSDGRLLELRLRELKKS
jgi:hypothetical protein